MLRPPRGNLRRIAASRRHLTYANVVSTLALFIVMGGTSYAVATGSIGSRAIKNNAIRGKDVRNGTLRSADIGNGSLLSRDFKSGELPGSPQGAAGARGATGTPGAPGAPGTAVAYAHVLADGTLDRTRTKNVVDVRPACSSVCSSPPPAGPNFVQCFKLGFTPTNAVATGEYVFDGTVVAGVAPLESYGSSIQCAPGYQAARTATARAGSPSSGVGFFVLFN